MACRTVLTDRGTLVRSDPAAAWTRIPFSLLTPMVLSCLVIGMACRGLDQALFSTRLSSLTMFPLPSSPFSSSASSKSAAVRQALPSSLMGLCLAIIILCAMAQTPVRILQDPYSTCTPWLGREEIFGSRASMTWAGAPVWGRGVGRDGGEGGRTGGEVRSHQDRREIGQGGGSEERGDDRNGKDQKDEKDKKNEKDGNIESHPPAKQTNDTKQRSTVTNNQQDNTLVSTTTAKGMRNSITSSSAGDESDSLTGSSKKTFKDAGATKEDGVWRRSQSVEDQHHQYKSKFGRSTRGYKIGVGSVSSSQFISPLASLSAAATANGRNGRVVTAAGLLGGFCSGALLATTWTCLWPAAEASKPKQARGGLAIGAILAMTLGIIGVILAP